MSSEDARRPLKVRSVKLFHNIAGWLGQRGITPNQISIASVVFAIFAAIFLLFIPSTTETGRVVLPLLAAFFIQCRLICNLLDGLVAVESQKGTASGELFNDIPDRIADPIILIAAGYATTIAPWAYILGWAAALLAVMTAYIRTLAASIGAPTDFSGPMAKQHRMALMTGTLLLTSVEFLLWPPGYSLCICLIMITIGMIITIGRRTSNAYNYLENRDVL